MKWCVALALLASACTSLLGIEQVTGDRDHDGIADDKDDCPDDYDPKQLDLDHDGIGDACGPCHAITYDLDHDGRDDSCDACIGPGPIGEDTDNDGIDDGCDPCVGGVGTTGSDIDGDGIDDGCDTCIASGLDRDQDGIDDACDSCLFGPPHDEDGDGIDDGCDVCPADPDPDQQHGEDNLGPACDPEPVQHDTRRLFDPFTSDDDSVWLTGDGWVVANDELHAPPAAGDRASFIDLRHNVIVRTELHFDPGATGALGISLNTAYGPPGPPLDCEVSAKGVLSSGISPSSMAVDTSGPVVLSAIRLDGVVECEVTDRHGGKIIVPAPEFVFGGPRLTLVNGDGVSGSFAWIEAIDRPGSN